MAERCFAFQEDFVCGSNEPDAPIAVRIAQPVGNIEPRGVTGNLPDDVAKIQDLLNQVKPEDGGSQAPNSSGWLNVDGLCGPLTRKAIWAFQKRQFPDRPPDDVVDPDQHTLYRLNQLVSPEIDAYLVAKAVGGLTTVQAYIAVAQKIVQLVLDLWQMPDDSFATPGAEALIIENFHLDRSTDRVRDLYQIQSVLNDMFTVSAHAPRGPYMRPAFGFITASPTQSSGQIDYAFCYAGGWKYYMGYAGTADGFSTKMRADYIYVTQRLLDTRSGAFVYVILHEMSHYVGGRSGEIDFIDDRAYYHRQLAKYERLSPYEAMTNADSFAQFVWQANTHTHFLP